MTMNGKYDLTIIGAGPGGYVAATRAAQLGMKTVVVEKMDRLGGVCLNVGCIPSKALLDSSEYYHLAKEHFSLHGIKIDDVGLDLGVMMARKDKVVEDLTGQVRQLLDGHKIEVLHGTALIKSPGAVEVRGPGGETSILESKNILVATGSQPAYPPGIEIDHERIVNSTDALSFSTVPEHLVVIGGGYIGLELGSLWRRLGAQVTVVEMLPQIAGALDGQILRTFTRILKSQGFQFKLNTRATSFSISESGVDIEIESAGKSETLTADKVLVAVGRKPVTGGLGLNAIGVEMDKSGRVLVDEAYQTNIAGVYAVGDIIQGPMLAHKASAEGKAAVECMAGKFGEVNYDAIPSVVYTWPEVASVGLTEEQLKERNIPYCAGSYPFSGAGRARCMGEKDGFVKVLAQAETDRVLGVHIIGPRAADIIAECVLALEFGASSEDIARTIHGHPTFSEALQEAAMGITGCSIYAS